MCIPERTNEPNAKHGVKEREKERDKDRMHDMIVRGKATYKVDTLRVERVEG